MNWKIEFNKRYENSSWWSYFFDDRKTVFTFIDNLLKKRQEDVLNDCIETILGCDENCAECEADNPHQDLWCPYKEKLSKLKEKYL
jgi:hypothetical protein